MHKKVCHLSAHLILTDFLIYINIKVLPYLKISTLICVVCCTTAVVWNLLSYPGIRVPAQSYGQDRPQGLGHGHGHGHGLKLIRGPKDR